jgi:hypothetical protein
MNISPGDIHKLYCMIVSVHVEVFELMLIKAFAIGDSNGKKELYVPCYENGYVAKYTY